ncbi:MAG: hypothetical protein Q4C10_11805 [Clostridia bacterium]|nr:hypothetical protein [Clostridia bacterium]
MKKTILALLLSACLLASALPALASEDYSQARPIALNQPMEDHLEDYSDVQLYTLALSEPGSLTLSFQFVPGGDYVVELLTPDDSGELAVLQYTNFYYDKETVTGVISLQANRMRLPAGTYYVRVRPYSASGWRGDAYVLTPVFQAEPGSDYELEFNDSARYAMHLDPNQSVNGNLAGYDDTDFYHFSLTQSGCLQMRFSFAPGGDYTFRLYALNAEGGLDELQYFNIYFTGESQSALIQRELDRQRLPAGEYYIEIAAYDSSGFVNDDYTLSLAFAGEAAPAWEVEFNNSGLTANPISLGSAVTGNLNSYQDEDFFLFSLDHAGSVAVSLSFVPAGDYIVEVYAVNADGTLSQIKYFNFYVSEESMLPQVTQNSDAMDLQAGTYFVRVTAYNSSGYGNDDYTLAVLPG